MLSYIIQDCNVDPGTGLDLFNLLRRFNHLMRRNDVPLCRQRRNLLVKRTVAALVLAAAPAPAGVVASRQMWKRESREIHTLSFLRWHSAVVAEEENRQRTGAGVGANDWADIRHQNARNAGDFRLDDVRQRVRLILAIAMADENHLPFRVDDMLLDAVGKDADAAAA